MVAQELAVLLLRRCRLVSLALGVTCRGMRPLGGALAPVLDIRLFKVGSGRAPAERSSTYVALAHCGMVSAPGTV